VNNARAGYLANENKGRGVVIVGHSQGSGQITRLIPQMIDDALTDVLAQGKPDPSWGLHLNDANIGIGDLVDIVGKQGAAGMKKRP
jgi:hypothetical protein